MAKLKPVRPKGKSAPSPGAIPCVVLILMGILLLSGLFFLVLQSGGK